jgi:pyruvate kinase
LSFPEAANVEDLWDRAVEAVLEEGLVQRGDLVVLTAGTAVNMPGTTNMIKVEVAE